MGTSILDRQRGALWGLAIGDALGAAVEFRSPGTFPLVTDYRDGGPHRIPAGAWTDDTSMALALADSIASVGWDVNDQGKRYLDWWLRGKYSVIDQCFDIGNTTSASLRRFQATGDAHSSGLRDEYASGNGSIMRLAPVPIHFAHLYPERLEELADFAMQSSRVTHGSDQCVSACRYMATALAALMQGEPRETVLDEKWSALDRLRAQQSFHPKLDKIVNGSYRDSATKIEGSGGVIKSLEASLWAFDRASSFEEAVLAAVNLGDDADTTGAVCGQFAGAYWGESGIPERWRKGLVKADMIEQALQRLIRS